MTDFLQDNENRFGQAKKDFQNMTDEPQPITEAEVAMMDSNAMLAKVLLYLQDNTLKPHEKTNLLTQLKVMGKDLHQLRTKIGGAYKDEMCTKCDGTGGVASNKVFGSMLGAIDECPECNGTGQENTQ